MSSTEIRSDKRALRIALIGDEEKFLQKFERECKYVNGIEVLGIFPSNCAYTDVLSQVDGVFLNTRPQDHYEQIKEALIAKKHVLCDSPLTTTVEQWHELIELASKQGCILMDANRTAYAMAYYRLLLLVKSGVIGDVVSIDASCTTLRSVDLESEEVKHVWNSICAWGPTALLPIFQLLGINYSSKQITSRILDKASMYDAFTKVTFIYPKAVASIKVGKGVKTEGELVISGTEGYVYVPAPWWKTDYFEIRREDPTQNRRYYYQLDGEGMRYMLVSFLKSISIGDRFSYISRDVSKAIVNLIQDYYDKKALIQI